MVVCVQALQGVLLLLQWLLLPQAEVQTLSSAAECCLQAVLTMVWVDPARHLVEHNRYIRQIAGRPIRSRRAGCQQKVFKSKSG
jgi:hypothetical protein